MNRLLGRERLSLIGSFHLIHDGLYFILFLNEINLKKNYCPTHIFIHTSWLKKGCFHNPSKYTIHKATNGNMW
jgi:hypothetical protein